MSEGNELLSESAAIRYLGRGRKLFKHILKAKEIGFKEIDGRKYFTTKELDRWQSDLTHHIDFTPEAKSTMSISRSELKKDEEYSFEKLLEQEISKKQSNTASKDSANYNRRQKEKKKAS